MMFVNYYSKIRNNLSGDMSTINNDAGKIITKVIRQSQWTASRTNELVRKAQHLLNSIDVFMQANPDLHVMYKTFHIPKHSGGFRLLHAPLDPLKALQNKVLKFLTKECKLLPHNAAHSFVKHRNCKTAIETHKVTGAKWFLKLDIEDFFGSCNPTYMHLVCKAIHPLGLLTQNTIAKLLSICFLDDKLPQGAPTSPMLSNLYMQFFDNFITKTLHGYTYTRYADDILISKTTKFDYITIAKLVQINLPNGLNLKTNKTRYSNSNGSNWNLGLMYNKDLNITVGYKNKHLIKNRIHNLFRNVPEEHTEEHTLWLEELYSLRGLIHYYKYIEPEYFNKLINKYKELGYNI